MANIIWAKPNGWVEKSGAHVTFKAPCNCETAGSLVIGENTYSIVDAIGRTITGVGGAFISGAVLDFILDCENLKAYLQNSAQADYIVKQGKSGIWTYRKWASGIGECWGSVVTNAYDGDSLASQNYPFRFYDTNGQPTVLATPMWEYFSVTAQVAVIPTVTTLYQVRLRFKSLNGLALSGKVGASVHVIGRWK